MTERAQSNTPIETRIVDTRVVFLFSKAQCAEESTVKKVKDANGEADEEADGKMEADEGTHGKMEESTDN